MYSPQRQPSRIPGQNAVRSTAASSPSSGVKSRTGTQSSEMRSGAKRFPVYYAAVLILLLLGVVALLFWLSFLRGFLADYEGAQSRHVADDVFYEKFKHPDFSALLEECGYEVSPFESKETLSAFLASEYTGSITYKPISTGLDSDGITYAVWAGDQKFALFTLKESGEVSRYGQPYYALSETRLLYHQPDHSFSIRVPSDWTVTVNGIPLTEENRIGEIEVTSSCSHMPEGVSGLSYCTYEVRHLIEDPVLSAKDRKGAEQILSVSEDGSRYDGAAAYDPILESTYASNLIETAHGYAAYMQGDGRFSAFSAALDPDSALYQQIKTAEVYFVWPHDGCSFEGDQAGEFYAYDDNTFSCRVSFTHLLHKAGSQDYRDPIDFTFYLRRCDDGVFRIYDLESH